MEAVIRVALLTVSDRAARGEREDLSGPALRGAVEGAGHSVSEAAVVADDEAAVAAAVLRLGASADLVLTTGGTGLSPRDRTPEATRAVVEREIPGFTEEIRRRSAEKDLRGLLSRAVAGVLPGGCLVLNLPGSPSGAVDCFSFVAALLPHAAATARGTVADCGPPSGGRR